MSYIRWGQDRKWSEGKTIYAYSSGSQIVCCGDWTVPPQDWLEVTMRMLERQIEDEELLELVHEELENELLRYDSK